MIFCQDAGNEANNTINLYGVFNTISLKCIDPENFRATVSFNVVVSVLPVDIGLSYELSLHLEWPDGSGNTLFQIGNNETAFVASAIIPIRFAVYQSGIHWLKLYLDGEFLAQSPLQIVAEIAQDSDEEVWQIYLPDDTEGRSIS